MCEYAYSKSIGWEIWIEIFFCFTVRITDPISVQWIVYSLPSEALQRRTVFTSKEIKTGTGMGRNTT